MPSQQIFSWWLPLVICFVRHMHVRKTYIMCMKVD